MHSSNNNRSSRRRPVAEINVVPYIDVMLVLLVIFMITAPLLMQGISVNLPQAKAKAVNTQSDEPIVVSVDEGGRFYLNKSATPAIPINPQDLMTQVSSYLERDRAQHKECPVYVKGDRAVAYDKVVQAMVLLQKAGADQVGLLTQPD